VKGVHHEPVESGLPSGALPSGAPPHPTGRSASVAVAKDGFGGGLTLTKSLKRRPFEVSDTSLARHLVSWYVVARGSRGRPPQL
jgi:hypothetical protein